MGSLCAKRCRAASYEAWRARIRCRPEPTTAGRRHTVVNNSFANCTRACVHVDNRGINWAHELCGCQCSFGTCAPGCVPGAAMGPGLDRATWAVTNTTCAAGVHGCPPFRFQQGARKLRCVGPRAAPPCTTRLPWLAGLLDDATGCVPLLTCWEVARHSESALRRAILGDGSGACNM